MRKKTLALSIIVTVAVSLVAVSGCDEKSATTSKTSPAKSSKASTSKDTASFPSGITPESQAQKALDAVKSHHYVEAHQYFMDQADIKTAVQALGGRSDASIGEAEYNDSHEALVEVFLGDSKSTPLMSFDMWRPDGWKVKYVYTPEMSVIYHFYEAINFKDYQRAYSYCGAEMRSAWSFEKLRDYFERYIRRAQVLHIYPGISAATDNFYMLGVKLDVDYKRPVPRNSPPLYWHDVKPDPSSPGRWLFDGWEGSL